jgi:hypothetical protein
MILPITIDNPLLEVDNPLLEVRRFLWVRLLLLMTTICHRESMDDLTFPPNALVRSRGLIKGTR